MSRWAIAAIALHLEGTKLATPRDLCLGVVAGGFFVAWRDQAEPRAPARPVAPAVEPVAGPVAVSLGGETGSWRKKDPGGRYRTYQIFANYGL